MNVRKNRSVLPPHDGVSEHSHVRLDLGGLVVGREKSEAERRVQFPNDWIGLLPNHFVSAAGVRNQS